MKKWFFALTALSGAAFAGYGPNQEMGTQLQEILSKNEVTTEFPLGVQSVEKVSSGYLLKGEGEQMLVDVIELPSDSMGRPKYKLRFHSVEHFKR